MFHYRGGFVTWWLVIWGLVWCTLSCIIVNQDHILVRYGATERMVSAKAEPFLFWLNAMIPAGIGMPGIVAAIWIFVLAIQDRFAVPQSTDQTECGKVD